MQKYGEKKCIKNDYQILFKPLLRIILKPILDCFFKNPLELEAAFFHLFAPEMLVEICIFFTRAGQMPIGLPTSLAPKAAGIMIALGM